MDKNKVLTWIQDQKYQVIIFIILFSFSVIFWVIDTRLEKLEMENYLHRKKITDLQAETDKYKYSFLDLVDRGIGGVTEKKEPEKLNRTFQLIRDYNLLKYQKTFEWFQFPVLNPDQSYTWSKECEFGYRVVGNYHFHEGLDIVSPLNLWCMSSRNGVVKKTGYSKEKGNYIEIIHNVKKLLYTGRYETEKYKTIYGHLFWIGVQKNEHVRKNQRIGIIGDTGDPRFVKGVHLHFEIWKYDKLKKRWLNYNFVCNTLHGKRVILYSD